MYLRTSPHKMSSIYAIRDLVGSKKEMSYVEYLDAAFQAVSGLLLEMRCTNIKFLEETMETMSRITAGIREAMMGHVKATRDPRAKEFDVDVEYYWQKMEMARIDADLKLIVHLFK